MQDRSSTTVYLSHAEASHALPADSRLTPEKFLNRLPKFVIRQGEVVDIRGAIRDTLQVRPALATPVLGCPSMLAQPI